MIGNIPQTIMAKIKGDIQLYVTAEDLTSIYNNSIIAKIDNFLVVAEKMTHGDIWGDKSHSKFNPVLWGKRQTYTVKDPNSGKKLNASQDDVSLAKKLIRAYWGLNNISFSPTRINMSDQNNIKRYLTNDPGYSITVRTLKGSKSGTYFQILQSLSEDLNNQKSKIEVVTKALQDKYAKILNNQSWAMIGVATQELISQSIQYTGKVISIIANLTKYIYSDIATITNSVNKIAQHTSNKSQQVQ